MKHQEMMMRRKKQRSPKSSRKNNDAVTVRLSPRLKLVLGGMAALSEMSLEKYVLRILKRQADAIEGQTPTVTLSARDFRRFLEICENDSPPSPALIRAAREFKRRYRDQIEKGDL